MRGVKTLQPLASTVSSSCSSQSLSWKAYPAMLDSYMAGTLLDKFF